MSVAKPGGFRDNRIGGASFRAEHRNVKKKKKKTKTSMQSWECEAGALLILTAVEAQRW